MNAQVIDPRGTFAFCEECPACQNCCTRLSDCFEIGSPQIFDSEIKEIETILNRDRAYFLKKNSHSNNVRNLKTSNGKCVFFSKAKCGIYNFRPMDCRLFPFDIRMKNEKDLQWILYNRFCPSVKNYSFIFNEVKDYFFGLKIDRSSIFEYARNVPVNMKDADYIEIEVFSYNM